MVMKTQGEIKEMAVDFANKRLPTTTNHVTPDDIAGEREKGFVTGYLQALEDIKKEIDFADDEE